MDGIPILQRSVAPHDPDYAEWVVENIEAENIVVVFVEVMERRQRGLR